MSPSIGLERIRPARLSAALAALVLVVAACGGSSTGDAHDAAGGHHHGVDSGHGHGGTDHGSVPGEAAPAREATRTVEVVATDELQFQPATIRLKAGETVTFVVTNAGSSDHEFVLGDEAYQRAHEMEMSKDEMQMTHSGNAVALPPGATKRVTWKFTGSGEVLYGCHLPGHYEGGMVGTIYVFG